MLEGAASERSDLYSKFSKLANNTNQRFAHVIHAVEASAKAIEQIDVTLKELTNDVGEHMQRFGNTLARLERKSVTHSIVIFIQQKVEEQHRLLENLRQWTISLDKLLQGKVTPFLVLIYDLSTTLHKLDRWCDRRGAVV